MNIRADGGKFHRLGNRDKRVPITVKDQARLRKLGLGLEPAGVLHQLIANQLWTARSVMEDWNTAFFPPEPKPFGSKLGGPERMEAKGGREQDYAVDFRMASGVESGQVSAQARTDDDSGLMAAQAFDQSQLFSQCQSLEIAFGQVGNFDGEAEREELLREEARLPGGRAGSEAVQIKDTRATGQYLHLNGLDHLTVWINCYSRRLRTEIAKPPGR